MKMYEPKNRVSESLDVLTIIVEDNVKSHEFDPNTFAHHRIENTLSSMLEPMYQVRSILSGECGGVIYKADDLEIPLTIEELDRFAARSLEPEEYFTLLKHYGMAFEWHEDFYCSETGLALQPMFDEDEDED
jgi:hypothetical protein